MSGRALPVLDMLPPSAGAGARQAMPEPALAEFVTEAVTQPAFHVWTLGCQMNRSDSEEMAGAPAGGRLRRGRRRSRRPTSSSSTAAPSARPPSRRSSGGWAPWPACARRRPGLRVVLTGCCRARPTTRPACGGATRRSTCSCGRTRSPSSSPAWAWPARRRPACWAREARPGTGRPLRGGDGRPPVGDAGPPRWGRGASPRGSGIAGLAADHLRLRQDVHLLHRAVQPRTGAQPAVRRRRRRGAPPGVRRATGR